MQTLLIAAPLFAAFLLFAVTELSSPRHPLLPTMPRAARAGLDVLACALLVSPALIDPGHTIGAPALLAVCAGVILASAAALSRLTHRS